MVGFSNAKGVRAICVRACAQCDGWGGVGWSFGQHWTHFIYIYMTHTHPQKKAREKTIMLYIRANICMAVRYVVTHTRLLAAQHMLATAGQHQNVVGHYLARPFSPVCANMDLSCHDNGARLLPTHPAPHRVPMTRTATRLYIQQYTNT